MIKNLLLEDNETVSSKLPLHPEGLLSLKTDYSARNPITLEDDSTNTVNELKEKGSSQKVERNSPSYTDLMIHDSFSQQEIADVDMLQESKEVTEEGTQIISLSSKSKTSRPLMSNTDLASKDINDSNSLEGDESSPTYSLKDCSDDDSVVSSHDGSASSTNSSLSDSSSSCSSGSDSSSSSSDSSNGDTI